MPVSPDLLLEEARKLAPRIVSLRREIHAEPELGLELPRTREKILRELDDLDLPVELHERTSGIVVRVAGARPGRRLLLRGDMDALPMPEDTDLPFRSRVSGAMHACGHDAHVAMLAGAVRLLAGRRDDFAGEAVFMFQPGEEGFAGARYMIEEGVLEGVDAGFAIHIAPNAPLGFVLTRPGPLLASADVFEVVVRGRGGHASMPHDCTDPVPVACEIVGALQSFVTRRIPVFEPAVLTVTKIEAGTTSNVIPETATLSGTIRAVSARSRERVHEGLQRIASGIAGAHGVSAEVDLTLGYPVTSNDAEFAAFALDVARELTGEQRAVELPAPMMGAEDWSYVLEKVPGAMVMLGVRPDGPDEPAPCHSNRMLLNEDGLPLGTALHAAVALRYLAA